MNRQLRLAAAAAMMAAVQIATAQVKMAPNYFRADPAVYKYRMTKSVDWAGSDYEKTMHYVYDSRGCLINEIYDLSTQPRFSVVTFSYDDNGYMTEKEQQDIKADKTDSIITARHAYERDEHGYITQYSRATLHGEDPNDRTLTEDVKMDFKYDSQMRLTSVDIRQFDYALDQLEENVGRICKIEYDAAGHVSKVSQLNPDGETLIWAEEFEYDEKGRRTAITKVPGPEYTDQQVLTWTWTYNDEGDITESGRDGFMKEFTYDKTRLASETFMPLEATEAEWVLQGPLNCTLFKELPMEKCFTHAPKTEVSNESYVEYEEIGSTAGIALPTAAASLRVVSAGSELTIISDDASASQPFSIYNTTGVRMISGTLGGGQTKISTQTFSPGIYLLSAGEQTIKFIK